MRSFTIAIATYRRRDVVTRLVASLADDLRASPELARDVGVLVVVDGSEDGTVEALAELQLPVPFRVEWQTNAGLAATRHRSIELSQSEVVWFLDDDVLPAPGTFVRHRTAHEQDADHVLVGPCVLAPEAPTVPVLKNHYDRLWSDLARRRSVDRFDRFSAANTSASVRMLQDVGGFDLGFRGYGREDFELGHRLLQAGVRIDFDPAAVAWHHQERTLSEFLVNAVSEGTNSVRLVRLHPELYEQVIPTGAGGRSYRLLGRLRVHHPAALWAVSRAAAAGAGWEARWSERTRLFDLAYTAAFASGVARADPGGETVARIFGKG